MLIQWFPGHMTKTKRMIEEHLKAVDVVAELLDARMDLINRKSPGKDLIIEMPPYDPNGKWADEAFVFKIEM